MKVLKTFITEAKARGANTEQFLKLVRRYTEFSELDAEIIREFIDRIIVHQAEKVNGRRIQRIQIIYNCVGAVEVPKIPRETA